MPSVYNGCTIQDSAYDALSAFNNHLQEIEEKFDSALNDLDNIISSLENEADKAYVFIGNGDWEVKWEAVVNGTEGNKISIQYIYQSPGVDSTGNLVPKEPYAKIMSDGVTVHLYLGVDNTGTITYNMNDTITKWYNSLPELADLVTSTITGSGTDIPETTNQTFLSGGTSQVLKDIQDVGNDIANVFGKNSMKDLLQSIDIPTISSPEEAASFLEEDGKYIIIGKKVFIVDGTNLVGLNRLYAITADINKVKDINVKISDYTPTAVITQNVTRTTTKIVCGEVQTFNEINEIYRGIDISISTAKAKWGGDAESFNYYIFWGKSPKASMAAYQKLSLLGLNDDLINDIMEGNQPEDTSIFGNIGTWTVEDTTLLEALAFTDEELIELLSKNIDGIKIPNKMTNNDKITALLGVFADKIETLENGAKNLTKAPIAAIQTVDLEKTLNVDDIAREMALRGKACARLGTKVPDMYKFYNDDIPNISFSQLPDTSKKVESAYAAISAAIEKASSTFDRMVGKLVDSVSGLLNKISDILNLAANMGNNDLAKCLLGFGTSTTGKPEFSGINSASGISSGSVDGIPNIESVTGGIPLSLFKSVLDELAKTLDEVITDAVATVMEFLMIPMCLAESIISSISGFDLGGVANICKDSKDYNEKCDPYDIQEIIDKSTDMAATLNGLSYSSLITTTEQQTETTETVKDFIGTVATETTTITPEITRGINEVVSELQDTINAKVSIVDKLNKAINDLFSDVDEQKTNIDESADSSNSCLPPVLGLFTDNITDNL